MSWGFVTEFVETTRRVTSLDETFVLSNEGALGVLIPTPSLWLMPTFACSVVLTVSVDVASGFRLKPGEEL